MESREEYSEWLRKGEEDFQAAVFLRKMFPQPVEIICYHFQQSSEKFLKGYLVFHNQPVTKTHDLSFLLDKCVLLNTDFERIRNECERLTDYGVATRYPGNIEISISDLEKAFIDCTEVINFVKSLSF